MLGQTQQQIILRFRSVLLSVVLLSLIQQSISAGCHETCLTCTHDNDANACLTCVPNRGLNTHNQCICLVGFVEPSAPVPDFSCVENQCSYTCPGLCLATSSYCTDCVPGHHRTLTANKCDCDVGYFDDGSNSVCAQCDSKCETCVGSAVNCEACKTNNHRIKDGSNNCVCESHYFDDGTDVCKVCSHKCQACETSFDNCISCQGTDRGTAPSCLCLQKFFDDEVNPNCQACLYHCRTCTNGSSCATCDDSKGRALNSATGQCVCKTGFFDITGDEQCGECNYTCLTCSGAGADNCLSCNSTARRTKNTNNECVCSIGFYAVAGEKQCSSCHATCASCDGGNDDDCLSCNTAANRISSPDGGRCNCLDKFYALGNLCFACDPSCETCTSGGGCLTCPPGKTNTGPGGRCVCPSGSVDVSGTCTPCDKCATCSGIPSNCTTCVSAQNRQLVGNQCLCKLRFFDNGVDTCQSCDYQCLTCTSVSTCATCNPGAHRVKSSSDCVCENGYFDDGLSNQQCLLCDPKCLTCSSSAVCLTCDQSSHHRHQVSGQCVCLTGYFEDQNTDSPICSKCNNNCETCQNSADNCLTCAGTNRVASSQPTCPCQTKYFDDGVNPNCVACDYTCSECVNPYSCSSCSLGNHRIQNSLTGLCRCDLHFFDDGINQQCDACHFSCLTCSSDTATSCITCNATAFRQNEASNSTCMCKQGYFEVADTELCSQCNSTCLSCNGPSQNQCLTCDTSKKKQFDSTENVCKCFSNHYVTVTQECQPCHWSCLTCTNASECDTCPNTYVKNTVTGKCECPSDAVQLISLVCDNCDQICVTCSGTTSNCSSCDFATQHRIPSANTCICAIGYFDNGVAVCQKCDFTCQTCDSSGCITCNPTYHRKISAGACLCEDGYFTQAYPNPLCLLCDSSCKTCTNQTGCLSCDTDNNWQQVSDEGLCKCKSGYFLDTTVNQCKKCSHDCQECLSTTTCLNCPPGTNRFLNGSTLRCDCEAKFYNLGVLPQCQSCHHSCATCTTGSVCASCDSGQNRQMNGATGLCSCFSKFFEDTTDNNVCKPCHYSCSECSGPDDDECVNCTSTKFRIMSTVAGTCLCQDGYFDDGAQELCQKCHYSCLKCSDQNTCTQCDPATQRTYNGLDQCLCPSKMYDDGSSPLCKSCHYSCETCTSAGQCSTCNEVASFREDDPLSPLCRCKDAYYDTGFSEVCSQCPHQCQKCTNSTMCQTCRSADEREYPELMCPCKFGFFNVTGVNQCQPCHVSCVSCSLVLDNCTQCNEAISKRVKVGTTCACITGYFDNGGKDCLACDYTCLNCSGTAEQCTSCDAGNQRTLSGSSCPCNPGYYNNGFNPMCQKCHDSCLTCVNGTSCETCKTVANRVQPPTLPGLCVCKPKFFELAGTTECKPCLYHCATCLVGDKCTGCNSAANRNLSQVNGKCECLPKFYDNNVTETCLNCDYSCKTCIGAESCETCETSDFRIKSSVTNLCVCMDKYFENPSQVCQPCHHSCQTCTNDTACFSCSIDKHRFPNGSGYCGCIDGYFDDNTNEECKPCDYTCKTCINDNTCEEPCQVSSGRIFQVDQCICPDFFFDDGSNSVCQKCHHSCRTCLSLQQCETCEDASHRIEDPDSGFCICKDSFFDNGILQLCQDCPVQCETCTNLSTCLTCDPAKFRNKPQTKCPCIDGYFQNTVLQCQKCHYTCKTCLNSTDVCLSCQTLNNRFKNPSNNSCTCMEGFYDDGAPACKPCHYTCAHCWGTHDNCTLCDGSDFRSLVGSTCPCDKYYYNFNLEAQCRPCHYSCETCDDEYSCLTCDSDMHRKNGVGFCECEEGYYDTNTSQQMCLKCDPTCKSCLNSVSCATCKEDQNWYLNLTATYNGSVNPFCSCIFSMYYEGNPPICQDCDYTCSYCQGPTENDCLFCDASKQRLFVPLALNLGQCICADGYYDDGVLQNCLECHPNCALCGSYSTTDCTECNPPYYLTLAFTSCTVDCPERYFEFSSNYTCLSCQNWCLECVNETHCTKCQPGKPLYRHVCRESCPIQSSFLDPVPENNKCIDCPEGCLTCNSLIECTSCLSESYYLDQNYPLCFPCNPDCKGCFGPGQDQCLDCSYPLYFRNNKCYNISCGYGQYVHSKQGCLDCKQLFEHSLTCTIFEATLCERLYKVNAGQCLYCTEVPGFAIANNGDCAQICGDGILIEYQCDDGNNQDGDGCSANCLIESGWFCQLGPNGESLCTIQGAVTMTITQIFKYGGQNKIRVYVSLSIPIRLNLDNFMIEIQSIEPEDYSWDLRQNNLDLSLIQIEQHYRQAIEGKQIRLQYISGSRRLLQAAPIEFEDTFIISSYPPAFYYDESQINSMQSIKNAIYIGSIILLCLCGINFLFLKKMYIHLFTAAVLPAQMYIFFGTAVQNQTDWIKWSLENLHSLAFVGGFRVSDYELATSPFLRYSLEMTRNTGIATCCMFGFWIIYGLLLFIRKYVISSSETLPKIIMYSRYVILTIQFCLFPHMAYSSVNSLYHSSLTSQASSINVCIAIFLNVYLLGLISALFILTKQMKANQLMIEADRQQQQSLMDNISHDEINGRLSSGHEQLNDSKPSSSDHVNQTSAKINPDNIDTGRSHENYVSDSYTSRTKGFLKPENSLTRRTNPNPKNQHNEQEIIEAEYGGLGYWRNNRQVYKKIEETYLNQWLVYDYTELYYTGGINSQKKQKSSIDQILEDDRELVVRKYSVTKYYLPITILRLYIYSLIASVSKANTFVLFIILGSLSLFYFFYILATRPFRFMYSNIRILVTETLMMALFALMAYYCHNAINTQDYNPTVQKAIAAIIATTIIVSIVLLLLETLGAWRMEIWNKVEPCLVALRLRGARKVMKFKRPKPRAQTPIKIIDNKEKEDENQQPMDAFFARMLKKQSIEKQYRRERFIKNPRLHIY